jgi:predicted tellurium resistance membrane protein TerC
MTALLTSPEAWAALLTLTALEIVLGIDNVIFLSVIVSRIPQAKRSARGRSGWRWRWFSAFSCSACWCG